MNFDDEMDQRLAQARQSQAAAAEAAVRGQQEAAKQAAEYDRLSSELLTVSRQCAERLQAAGVPTQPILWVDSWNRDTRVPTYVHRGNGWSWSLDGNIHWAPYRYVSIRDDGVFGRGATTQSNGVIPDGVRGGFVWDDQSQDPPSVDALGQDDFTVRKGILVMKWFDVRDGVDYSPVLDRIVRGTATLLVAQENA